MAAAASPLEEGALVDNPPLLVPPLAAAAAAAVTGTAAAAAAAATVESDQLDFASLLVPLCFRPRDVAAVCAVSLSSTSPAQWP
jgi:hypothetical protein